MAHTSELAMADDAGDARRDPLWRELPVNLLPWRSAGARQPHSAGRHLGWASDADRAQSRWHPGDDRSRNAAELDQDQTKAATRGDLGRDWTRFCTYPKRSNVRSGSIASFRPWADHFRSIPMSRHFQC